MNKAVHPASADRLNPHLVIQDDNVAFKILHQGSHKLLFTKMFDIVFPLIFYKKSKRNRKEQHKEFPEIMVPFFSLPMAIGSMTVMMHFHARLLIFFQLLVYLNS
jgi:hypothetical protein